MPRHCFAAEDDVVAILDIVPSVIHVSIRSDCGNAMVTNIWQNIDLRLVSRLGETIANAIQDPTNNQEIESVKSWELNLKDAYLNRNWTMGPSDSLFVAPWIQFLKIKNGAHGGIARLDRYP